MSDTGTMGERKRGPERIWLHGIGCHHGETTWCDDPNPSGEPEELEDAKEYVRADVARLTPTTATSPGPYTSTGKQILANGFHYADALDDHTAAFIVDALNRKVSRLAHSDETAGLVEAQQRAIEQARKEGAPYTDIVAFKLAFQYLDTALAKDPSNG